ncbi:MAG: transcriptional regulator [Rhizobium sp.]|nr:transcriptional regulator [Rhizobium sp.]
MYQPPHFREERIDVLHALIRAHPLGTVISVGPDGEAEANVIPLLFDETRGDKGFLKGHFARANAQWKMLAGNGRVLVVFQGPDSYVTPSWYQTKIDTGKVVPTWNYAMVQVRGNVTVHENREWLGEQVRQLTRTHEEKRSAPWAVDDAPEAFIDSQLKGIVGIDIEITSIDGKWKVSQNRPVEDRVGVAKGLEGEGDAPEMVKLVKEYGGMG